MRYRFDALLVIVFILITGFVGTTESVQDQSSIVKAVALIKMCVVNQERINVTIVNSHNGRYTITSSIWVGSDSVSLSTHVVDMTGGKKNITVNIKKTDFLSLLDRASFPINSMKLAGHHQRISVKRNGLEDIFETFDGWALMNLLEYGE